MEHFGVVAIGLIALLIGSMAFVTASGKAPGSQIGEASSQCPANQYAYNETASGALTCSISSNSVGLVGYWPLDEGTGTIANDLSGFGNIGTLSGTTNPVWLSSVGICQYGGCLNFSTSQHQIVNTPLQYTANQKISFSAWVSPASSGTIYVISGSSWLLDIDSSNKLHFFSCGHGSVTGTALIPPHAFTFVTLTVDGANPNNVNLYVNGILDKSGAIANQIVKGASFFLGGNNTSQASPSGCGGDNWFNGKMDDARFWSNRILSANDVYSLFSEPFPSPASSIPFTILQSPNLIGYWPMNEHSGTSTNDISGNGNSGTLNGAPTWQNTVNCKYGSCLQFASASAQYVSVPTVSTLDPNASPWTMNFWFKISSFASTDWMVMKGGFTNPGWEIYVETDKTFHCEFDDGTNDARLTWNVFTLQTGTWYMGTCSRAFDGTVSAWINGQNKVTSGTLVTGSVSSAYNLTFCKYSYGAFYCDATIDDVRLFNRVLFQAELSYLFNYKSFEPNIGVFP